MPWDVDVRTLDSTEYVAWDRFVAAAPGGSIYSLPAYLDALCVAAGGRFRILAASRGPDIVGGVGLYERSSSGGEYVSPRLLLYYNGVVIRQYKTQYPSESTARHVKILTAIEECLGMIRFGSVNLRSRSLHDARPFLIKGWSVTPSYSYVVSLDLKSAWTRVEQNIRRLVDRARNEQFTFSDDDDFDAFYDLHTTTLGRRDVGAYLPRREFAAFYATLRRQSLARLYHVRASDGRRAASQLVLLGPHGVSHTVSAGADPEMNKLGATALLRWSAFESLAALGYSGNDLTDAALGSTTHFKSQFGGSLELTLVLQSPRSPRYRLSDGAVTVAWRARASVSEMARRLLRGRERRGAPREDGQARVNTPANGTPVSSTKNVR